MVEGLIPTEWASKQEGRWGESLSSHAIPRLQLPPPYPRWFQPLQGWQLLLESNMSPPPFVPHLRGGSGFLSGASSQGCLTAHRLHSQVFITYASMPLHQIPSVLKKVSLVFFYGPGMIPHTILDITFMYYIYEEFFELLIYLNGGAGGAHTVNLSFPIF